MRLLAADGCIRMGLRASEWITVAYFAYLAGAAAVVPGIAQRQRRRAIGTAIAVVIVVLTVAAFGTSALVWRDWMPLMYILLGYRLPALLVTSTNQELERWLLTLDRRWLGMENGTMISERAPRPVIELLELAYLFCYPMVPIGLACLHVAGLRAESDRFWTAVSWRCSDVTACFHGSPRDRRVRSKVGQRHHPGLSGASTCACSVSRAFS